MKPWFFAILAVIALGVALQDPQHKEEGNSVVSSVTDTVDPYLHQGLSSDTHEKLHSTTQDAVEFVQQTGDQFGVDLTIEIDK